MFEESYVAGDSYWRGGGDNGEYGAASIMSVGMGEFPLVSKFCGSHYDSRQRSGKFCRHMS